MCVVIDASRGSASGPDPDPARIEVRESWLHSPTQLERLFGLWPTKAGLTMTTPQYSAGPRSIPFHSLHVVLDGAVEFSADRRAPERVGRGDGFCLFPYRTYEYWSAPDADPPRMLWLAFDGPAAGAVVKRFGLGPDRPLLTGLRSEPFLAHLPALRSVLRWEDGQRDTMAAEFLVRFLGELEIQLHPPPTRPRGLGWVRQGKELLDVHFAAPITVAEVADLVGVDRSHFSKAFTAAVGESPSSYLRSVRLTEGRRLLRSRADLSVTKIALSVGYSDVVAFSRAYHRFFGLPPSRDRRH